MRWTLLTLGAKGRMSFTALKCICIWRAQPAPGSRSATMDAALFRCRSCAAVPADLGQMR